MTPIVIDCSVTIPWCLEDQSTPFTEAVLEAVSSRAAVAPALWALEVANVLAIGLRTKALTPRKAQGFCNELARLPVRLEDHDQARALGDVLELARKHGLSAYDAAYLEVALRLALPLASLDQPLRKAAAAEGVALFAS